MEIEPSWSPIKSQIVYSIGINPNHEIYKMNANGTGVTALTNTGPVVKERPTWSPDGQHIAYVRGAFSQAEIWVMEQNGNNKTQITSNSFLDMQPAWQPVPITTFQRPLVGKKRSQYSLVPAYAQCTNPNRVHGPPLASGSCNPATVQSPYVMTKNDWVGNFRVTTIDGDPNNQVDDSKIKFTVRISGLYRKDNLRGYNKELRAQMQLQITDRTSVPRPGGSGPGTAMKYTLGWTIPCFRPESDPNLPGTCSVNLKDDVLAPNLVPEGKRAVWEIDKIQVFDGGADYDGDTLGDNRLLAVPGLFVP
jgi:hypothetical protein